MSHIPLSFLICRPVPSLHISSSFLRVCLPLSGHGCKYIWIHLYINSNLKSACRGKTLVYFFWSISFDIIMILFSYICHNCLVPFCWIKFQCVCLPHFPFLLICWWEPSVDTFLGCVDQCSNKHGCTIKHIDLESFSYKLRNDTAGQCSSSVFTVFFSFEEASYRLSQWMNWFIFSPVVYKGS